MIETTDWQTKITCDKCGTTQTEPTIGCGDKFYKNGWVLNSRAKKYFHRCYQCLSKEEKSANDFAQSLIFIDSKL